MALLSLYSLAMHRADSGFNHVEPEKYTARLLHIKGRKVDTRNIEYCGYDSHQ